MASAIKPTARRLEEAKMNLKNEKGRKSAKSPIARGKPETKKKRPPIGQT